jgi:hypothetical protein
MTTIVPRHPDPDFGAFVKRALFVFMLGAIALALRQLAELTILVFGALLMAIGLRAATRRVAKATGLRDAVSLSAGHDAAPRKESGL